MRRRTFLQSLGVATAASLVQPARAFSLSSGMPSARTRLSRIGLELYSVRKAMRLDPERTLAAVRAAGYDDVELLWSFKNFDRTPQQVRATLDQEGLKAPSAHMGAETILTDWERRLDDARVLGQEYVIVAGLPASTSKTLDDWRMWADRFNTAGATARKAGVWLAFHNEPGYTKPMDGGVPYDVFVTRTDPKVVRLQLDIGNMTMGGGDPMQYLKRYRERYWSFHVKDVAPDRRSDTDLGTGTVNLRQLLAQVPEIQKKPCFVEQEGPSDEMAAARRNSAYLRALEF